MCTGYAAAWFTNLYNFRQRSLIERIFWSVPLSLSLSTIGAVLIGKFISLDAFVVILWICTAASLFLLAQEWRKLRRTGARWSIGWRPLGGAALLLCMAWMLLVILLLVDLHSGSKLYMSLAIYDHGMRVSWTESVLQSGVPPANWLYMYQHPAPMRYYYFWYVLCAAVARMTHLPVRAIFNASCVWSGFSLASLIGLYLKHFLGAGSRLRRQFLRAVALLAVTGLGVCVNLWNFFELHIPLPGYLEVWRAGQITSWLDSLLWDPHHVASLVCCMFGFLLAWQADTASWRGNAARIVFIAAAFASAFGLSIYVAFGFFLVMLAWAVWQLTAEDGRRRVLVLAAGGAGAAMLLVPYLAELMHGSSNVKGGGSVFAFGVREMIPPESLLATPAFGHIAVSSPSAARNLANLVLLAPGYAVELGFFFVVLIIYLVPSWRGRIRLSSAQRTLVFITVATLVIVSFIRSGVIESNDFGWRAALLAQFPLLLMGSELMTSWKMQSGAQGISADSSGLLGRTPHLVQAVASFALIFGVMTTIYQALMIRFTLPVHEMQLRAHHEPQADRLSHKAYISSIGYAQLDAAIPRDAVVQYNPQSPDSFWTSMDWLGVVHQTAIASDQGTCGAEFGGDASGCPAMAAAIDALYSGDATAEQARSTCGKLGIRYLVARIYDPVWNSNDSWVWTLRPVVADEEFRTVDCRQ